MAGFGIGPASAATLRCACRLTQPLFAYAVDAVGSADSSNVFRHGYQRALYAEGDNETRAKGITGDVDCIVP